MTLRHLIRSMRQEQESRAMQGRGGNGRGVQPSAAYGYGIVDVKGAGMSMFFATLEEANGKCRQLNEAPHLMAPEFKPFRVVTLYV